MRDVDEHASANDTMRVRRDIQTQGASTRDQSRGPAAIEFTAIRHVTEGVNMRMAVPVKLNPQEVRCEANVTGSDVNVVGGIHIIESRMRVVGTGDGIDREG